MSHKKKLTGLISRSTAPLAGGCVVLIIVFMTITHTSQLPLRRIGFIFAFISGGAGGFLLNAWFLKARKYSKKLDRREARYRELIENIDEIIFTLDPSGTITFISPSITASTGYLPSEVIGTFFRIYIHPDDISRVEDAFQRTLQGDNISMEWRLLSREGETLWVRSIANTIPVGKNKIGIQGILYNISYRKKTEEALCRGEERFRRMTENILDGLFIVENGTIEYVNRRACEILYSRSEELVGRDISSIIGDFILEKDLDNARRIVEKLKEEHAPVSEMEFWIRRKDNSRRYLHMRNSHATDSGGNITRYAVITDMTERRAVEEKLQETEERFRIIFNNAGDAVFIHEPGGIIREVNTVAVERLGYSYQDLLRMNTREISAPEVRERMPSCLEDYRKHTMAFRETVHRAKDGSLIPSEVNSRIIEYRGESLILSIARDIRERKRFENEIQRASKLESLGVLAGGIAHDFNNILMAIIGNISLAKMDSDSESEIYNLLTDAENASWRARKLTQQLLTFAKGGAPVKKTTSIADFIHEVATFALRGTNIQGSFKFSEDLLPVDIDEGQMSQVLHNLIINAQQAMPNGGGIEIKCENFRISKGSTLPLPGGEFVRISVSDQGPGVSEEHLVKIFDPFFTTKEGGSGLGLATSYSIIKKHGGYITAESPPGEGMTFHIYLPSSRKKTGRREHRDRLHYGKGEILLMDDDPMIRKVAGNMIEHLGYTVVFALDGIDALKIYEDALQSGHPFEAVVMDLTIPGGMGGKEAIRELLGMDPGAKVIVSSGYSNDQVMADYKSYGFSGVVLKPYRIEELGVALKNVIDMKKTETVS